MEEVEAAGYPCVGWDPVFLKKETWHFKDRLQLTSGLFKPKLNA